MSIKFGVDISRWQGNFNFDKAIKEGIEFIIIKGGGGDKGLYVDSKFKNNYIEAKKRNLPVGTYWYSKALNVTTARKEAEYFYNNVLKGRQFELPVYIDVEEPDQLALSKSILTDIIKAWCKYLKNKGYFVGIYASAWTFMSEVNDQDLDNYTRWIAQWDKKCTYTGKYGMWQFGGEKNLIRSTQIAGQTVDQNYMYEDFPTIIKNSNLNGFKSSTATSISKPTEATRTYMVKIKANLLNYREGPGIQYKIKGQVKKNEIYTIIDEINGWGKFKSGKGWINLSYAKKI